MAAAGFEFDAETDADAVEGRPGVYSGAFGDGWRIGNGINGGVVMCLATTALAHRLSSEGAHGDPLAFSGHFLTPSTPGPVAVETEVLRTGRTMSTGQMSVTQPGPDGLPVERMRALATFGDLAGSELVHSLPPPSVPPPDECISSTESPEFLSAATLLERIDIRLDPATAGWLRGKPSGAGEMRGWLRFRDGRDPDPVSLLFVLDALPPVAFDLGILGWAPTIEFSGHVRGRPAPGWLLVSLTSRNVATTLMEEDAVVWDSEGRFVAQSRQLCGIRRPRPAN